MAWFIVGGALGALQLGHKFYRKPWDMEHPLQAFGLCAALGAAVYGTGLWAVLG